MIYKKDTIDMSLVSCDFEEENGYIYISDEYTNNILKLSGYSDISEDDYLSICESGGFASLPHCYYSTNSCRNAYHYALWVLRGRFDLGEKLIATDALHSYYYAFFAFKGRFELGEPIISTVAEYSFLYARDVVKGRFELGEQIITTDAEYSYRYARDAIKGRFELCEPAIATNALYSYYYAHDVLNGRFELGESSIAVVGGLKKKYFELTGIQL